MCVRFLSSLLLLRRIESKNAVRMISTKATAVTKKEKMKIRLCLFALFFHTSPLIDRKEKNANKLFVAVV